MKEQFQRDSRATGIRLDIFTIKKSILLEQALDVGSKLRFPARISERSEVNKVRLRSLVQIQILSNRGWPLSQAAVKSRSVGV